MEGGTYNKWPDQAGAGALVPLCVSFLAPVSTVVAEDSSHPSLSQPQIGCRYAVGMSDRSEETKGLLLGFTAYLAWGFFPLYWPLLEPSTAYEVLAHRIIWSLVFMAIINSAMRLWRPVLAALRDRRVRRLLVVGLSQRRFPQGARNENRPRPRDAECCPAMRLCSSGSQRPKGAATVRPCASGGGSP